MNFPIPKILQCNLFIAKGNSQDSRIVRDYEIDLCLGGERNMYIDGRYYKITKGCLVFKKPGQFIKSNGDYNMYMLTLDFSRKLQIEQGKYLRSSLTPQQEVCDCEFIYSIPEVFVPLHNEEFKALYKALCDVCYPNTIDEAIQKSTVCEMLFLLLADAYRHNREGLQNHPNKHSYVEQICNYINLNYSKELSVHGLADKFSINKNHLIRIFNNELSMTPNQFILQTRLYYARIMLIQSEFSISNIALSCGFNTTSYFIKRFKEKYGVTPGIYKASYESKTHY